VTQAANDKQQLVPLIEAIEEQSGQKPEAVPARVNEFETSGHGI
jgi:ribosomal protein L5